MKTTPVVLSLAFGLVVSVVARIAAAPVPPADDPCVVALTKLHGALKKHVDTLGEMPRDLQQLLDLGFVPGPADLVSPRSISGRAPDALLADRTPWRMVDRKFEGWLLVSDEAIDRNVYALHADGRVQRFLVAPELWYGHWTVPEDTRESAMAGYGDRLVPGLELSLLEVPTTVARPAVIVHGFRRNDPIRDELRSGDRLLNVGGHQVTTLAELEAFVRARPDVRWTTLPLLVLREGRTIEIGLETPDDGWPSAPRALYPATDPAAAVVPTPSADPSRPQEAGPRRTPRPELVPAAAEGDLESVRRLLREGADPDTRDERGFTPLIIAVYHGHAAIVEELLAAGADINAVAARNETALLAAVDGEHPNLFRLLVVRGAKKEYRDDGGGTLLAAACHKGNVEMVRAVLAAGVGVNVDRFYREGRRFKGSALMVAASAGRTPVVMFLLGQGAGVNVVGEEGYTALMIAAAEDEREVVSALLAAGANPDLKNEEGKTALDLARDRDQRRVVEILEAVTGS